MIRAIIFDCFGVLQLNTGEYFLEHFVDSAQLRSEVRSLSSQADYGYIREEQLIDQMAELLGLERSFVAQYYDGRKKTRNEQLLDWSRELRKTYKIGMLSNVSADTIEHFFNKSERDKYFDATVLSYEVGMIKPHPFVFEETARRLGVLPGECIMIDDIEANCAGADAAGMKSVVYTSNEQAMRDVTALLK